MKRLSHLSSSEIKPKRSSRVKRVQGWIQFKSAEREKERERETEKETDSERTKVTDRCNCCLSLLLECENCGKSKTWVSYKTRPRQHLELEEILEWEGHQYAILMPFAKEVFLDLQENKSFQEHRKKHMFLPFYMLVMSPN